MMIKSPISPSGQTKGRGRGHSRHQSKRYIFNLICNYV